MRISSSWTTTFGLVAVLAVTACADRDASSQDASESSSAQEQALTKASSPEPSSVPEPAPAAAEQPEGKPIRIAQGQPVEIRDYLVPGQITVFDFMSDYCGPCVRLAPLMDRLHSERPDITVVKVDINRADVRGIDWRSPVARQYNMNSIPHFKIFGADGSLMAEGPAAGPLLDAWFRELVASGG